MAYPRLPCSPMHQRAYKNGSLIGQWISLVYATLHTTYGAGVSSVLSLWGSILYAVPTDHLTHYNVYASIDDVIAAHAKSASIAPVLHGFR